MSCDVGEVTERLENEQNSPGEPPMVTEAFPVVKAAERKQD